MKNKESGNLGNNKRYNILARSMTLSQKIVTLISIVVLCALLPASMFTTFRVAKVIYDRVSINAVSINVILCNSNEIINGISQKNLKNKDEVRRKMLTYVNHVDDSDEASVAVFDADKNLVVYYNPAGLKNFDNSAKELVEEYAKYDEITYGQNYNIPNKAIGFIKDKNDKKIGYVVTGYDLQSTPGVEYVTVDPTYIRDNTPAPPKEPTDPDEDYYWLGGA